MQTNEALAALGLPPTWAPAPFTFAVGKLELRTATDVQAFHVVRFDCERGVLGFGFPDEQVRVLMDALNQQATGLVVARDLPPNTNGRGH